MPQPFLSGGCSGVQKASTGGQEYAIMRKIRNWEGFGGWK